MMKRLVRLLVTIAEYASFSAVQFILSFVIGGQLSTEALAEFTVALLIATFAANTLRSAFLAPLLFAAAQGASRPSQEEWIALICYATAVCGGVALLASSTFQFLDLELQAAAIAASVPLLMTMALYDIARRRAEPSRRRAFALLLAFSGAVMASATLLVALPEARSALMSSLLVSACYAVASLAFLGAATRTHLSRNSVRLAWKQARGSIASSPLVALATGAIMQGLPLVATAGSPATLALFYLTRALANPAVNFIQALDALQKTTLRSAVGDGTLLRSALMTAGGTSGITIAYAFGLTALLSTLLPLLGAAYGQITDADVWASTKRMVAALVSSLLFAFIGVAAAWIYNLKFEENAFQANAMRTDVSGQMIAYATQFGDLAEDGQGRNSPYTSALLLQLSQRRVSITEAVLTAHANVSKATGGRQSPFLSTNLNADLYLNEQPSTRRRIAIVVGVNQYQYASILANPVNDARDMAALLSGMGFDVKTLIDPTAQEMRESLKSLTQKSNIPTSERSGWSERIDAPANTLAVFFFAGFGVYSKGTTYLIPSDAQLRSEAGLDSDAVSLELVKTSLRRNFAVSLIFLDADSTNPFAR